MPVGSSNVMNTVGAVVELGNSNVKQKKRKNISKILFWASECRYSVILDLVQELDWKLIDDEKLQSKLNLFWIDVASIHEHFRHIQPWQMINHFPGMPNVARKNRMGQNLNRMQKLFPKEYSFYPRTWVLPTEMNDFRTQFDNGGNSLNNKIYIIKPDAGCQGRGIFLTRTIENVPFNENVVAQVYIKKPLLIDGFKFDLRLYCIVTCVKPLRMYLFHDGLVRMCTEEYVKPTKENLGMACMHLTNYAVNKHNENFQQPSAASSEECQDEGSKRSLLWFMNWIRKEHGDSKADWLWKRMGTLCTRTIISILPTLSREYDQHFKSFSGIPVDITQIPVSTGLSNTPLIRPPGISKLKPTNSSTNVKNRSNKESGSEDDDEETTEVDQNHSQQVEETMNNSKKDAEDSTGENNDEKSKSPHYRGSRCFEVLGFDIMIDGNLNPWLIEVNHLPSFGTDSPLDKDIKERLMQQVFSVLPVMADDQLAYNAFHKAEAEKRLVAQKIVKEQQLAVLSSQKDPIKAKPPKSKRLERTEENGNAEGVGEDDNKEVGEVLENKLPLENENGGNLSMPPQEENGTNGNDPLLTESCSPERVEEIKQILIDIYEKKSPEKINKIDRLLAKYNGHEEEFLLFVFSKYSIDPNEYENSKPRTLRESEIRGVPDSSDQVEGGALRSDVPKDTSDLPSSTHSEIGGSNNHKPPAKRYSRSLSPPRSLSSNRRSSAAWKQSQPDEEITFRHDVLSIHVPNEEDEWMQMEMSKLTQCTRIFPSETKLHDGKSTEDDDKEEQEENEEEADEKQKLETAPKFKSASYEEIIAQVFLQDRRQTMRLRCPLPNRAKPESENSNNFLPPLDPPNSGRASVSTLGSGKGVVGWKAPPKPIRNEPPKQPTALQTESAKRLSQGLSVATTIRNRNATNSGSSNSSVQPNNEAQYSVVLDPQEYNTMNGYVPVQNGAYTNGNYIIWPSTKAHRLYEESRNNRLRIEAARANNGAVLRQQIFFFDPNQEIPNINPSGAPGASNPTITAASLMINNNMQLGGDSGIPHSIPDYMTAAIPSTNGIDNGFNNANNQPPISGVGVTRSSFIQSKIPYTVVSTGGIIPTNSSVQPSASSYHFSSGGGSSKAPPAGALLNNMNFRSVQNIIQTSALPPNYSAQQQQQQSLNNMGPAAGSNAKQEELLRQLFPSWF